MGQENMVDHFVLLVKYSAIRQRSLKAHVSFPSHSEDVVNLVW